uniref:tumor necrosis factor receptor superfamily member 6 isoform X1 n=1 Tax=Jaculus jaculus TaxID=51337 RepID=UPI001E1B2878|nr:tumor necrosis factor receptor superfamily member 6 isoform X1 [Jaculus jaculus]
MPRSAVLTIIAGSLPSVNAQNTGAGSTSEELGLKVTGPEAEAQCSDGLYRVGQFCCKPCQPGEHLHLDCPVNGGKAICKSCREGEEYTDRENYSAKCRRCGSCDGGHGLEVETSCTRTQNTKCRCKPNFYCNASVCEHCEPCTTCEYGIVEQCTPTSNTKCKTETAGPTYQLLWLLSLLLVPVLSVPIFKRWRNKNCHRDSTMLSSENMPMNFSDVDLNKYIISIAEEMTINQATEFVRKNGISEAKIDEIKNDNFKNTAEQKVQLLRNWYQSHGKKDAYNTLIKGLRRACLYVLADKIQELVQRDTENSTSNLISENERQSLA